MKRNKMQLMIVAVAAAAGLSACGGGSSYHSTTTHIVSGGETAKPMPKSINQKIVGSSMNLKNTGGEVTLTPVNAIKGAPDIAAVKVGDKYVSFDAQGVVVRGSWMTLNARNEKRVGTGSGYSNTSRFGYFFSSTEGVPDTFFVQGIETEKMPTTGKATYTGYAVHIKDGQVYNAKSKFDVDYGKKKVAGTIDAGSSGKVSLAADISGNKFTGSKGGIGTIGHFYGDNAAELGGVYKNSTGSVGGVYGAQK